MEKNKTNNPIGIKEIAKRANVAIATVDRVIHNRTGVSQRTKDKINAIIKKLDYQPNILARRLASGKILRIGILMPAIDEGSQYWRSQLQGIEEAEAEIKQYGINIHKYFFDAASSSSFVKSSKELLQQKMDAVLLIPIFPEEAQKFIATCKQKGISVAFLNSDIGGEDHLFYIGPHLYQSGYQAAELLATGVDTGKMLIVNIMSDTDNEEHLSAKEAGFKAWFNDNNIKRSFVKLDIRSIELATVNRKIKKVLAEHKNIQAIFVTGSRVSLVAATLEKYSKKKILLVGYDFLEENIRYLKKNVIDFLICQKLHEQGYKGTMTLYQKLVFNTEIETVYYMPIDIVTRENYTYYNN